MLNNVIVTMKVIVAGLPKTGTKSMNAALKILGYDTIYDYPENFQFLSKEWTKILTEGANKEDFQRMYKNVDVCMDAPCCHYWEEIHEAFPESKMIFTKRDNEDEWYKSFQKQMKENTAISTMLMTKLSHTCSAMFQYGLLVYRVALGVDCTWTLSKGTTFSELSVRQCYRRHNTYIQQKAPKEATLEYNVKDGWGPLCKFLNRPVPNVPFPHKNKGGDIIKEYMETHPLFFKIQRETLLSLSVLVGVVGYTVYSVVTNPFDNSVLGIFGKLLDVGLNRVGYCKIAQNVSESYKL